MPIAGIRAMLVSHRYSSQKAITSRMQFVDHNGQRGVGGVVDLYRACQ